MTIKTNSIRVRLFAALLLVVVLIGVLVLVSLQTNSRLNRGVAQVNLAGRQRSNAYLLASLSRRLAVTEDAAAQESIVQLMRDVITNFSELQDGLRHGSEALGVDPVERSELVIVLDEIELRWQSYSQLLERFIAADDVTRDTLLDDIDSQSVTVFTFSDRLTIGIEENLQQQERTANQIFIGLVVLAVIAVLFTVYVVLQSMRSINELTQTTRAFAEGNFKVRAEISQLDETGRLGTVFNTMAEQIGTLVDDLGQQVIVAQEARDHAEQADRVKSMFLASVSHELRTPLNSVINFTKFVIKGMMGPVTDKQVESLNKVVDSAKHLLSLINDVLDMSKIESGSLNLVIVDNVNLNIIVTSAVATAESLLQEKSVELKLDIDPNLPTMRGDRQRVLQILLNIISNACKFTDTGYVKISAHCENNEVNFAIQDTGAGIAPEDQGAVFEPFKQTETGLRQAEGTGLGMPISKSLVEAHGGKMWLASTLGQGSTFYVTLPLQSDQLQPAIAS